MINYLKTEKPNSERVGSRFFELGFLALFFPLSQLAFTETLDGKIFGYTIAFSVSNFLVGFLIKRQWPIGKRLGQCIQLFLFFLLLKSFTPQSIDQLFIFRVPIPDHFGFLMWLFLISVLFPLTIIFVTAVTTFYGVLYLEKLSARSPRTRKPEVQDLAQYASPVTTFGIFSHFLLYLLLILGVTQILQEVLGGVWALFFLIAAFLTPLLWNMKGTKFEKSRQKLADFTEGGVVDYLVGSTPFFRILLYEDGMEIRVFFKAFFIPYQKMQMPTLKSQPSRLIIRPTIDGLPPEIQIFCSTKGPLAESILKAWSENTGLPIKTLDQKQTRWVPPILMVVIFMFANLYLNLPPFPFFSILILGLLTDQALQKAKNKGLPKKWVQLSYALLISVCIGTFLFIQRHDLLHYTCQNHQRTFTKILLALGADPNVEDYGFTALHYAILSGDLRTLEIILESGGDTKVTLMEEDSYMTTLDFACCLGHTEMANLLMEKGVGWGKPDPYTQELILEHCGNVFEK